MALRSGVRPSLPFVYSLFVYVTRIRKITVALLTAVLLSNPVAAATLGAAPFAANKGQDLRYEFYSSGWAKSLGINLTSTAQGSGKGWDGKGAPRRNRPAPARAESNAEREARVAQIKIYPGDVEIKTGQSVVFAAVGFDSKGNTIGGLDVKWEALHEDEGRKITMGQGLFSSSIPGKFIVTAEVAGRREQVKVTVKGNSVLPEVKSTSEIKIDSRELRRKQQISRLAPSQGDEKRLIAGKNVTGKQLRAFSKSMGRAPGMLPLLPDLDGSGWNPDNIGTFSNVGAERGDVPGRAPSAGVGSGNFQITAPGVSLGGRGIDVNLPLHYNSRVWHKSGDTMYFDIDRDTLAAGWNLGFGKIVMTGNQYMLVDGDGTRHEFTGITNIAGDYQEFHGCTTDGTFIDYRAGGYAPGKGPTDGKNIWHGGYAQFPNGTTVSYASPGNYAVYPGLIVDAHGNYIYITYLNDQGPNIETITDSLGRVIRFHYDNGNLLTAITVPGLNGGPERQVVRLAYRNLTLSEAGTNYGFSGISTVVRQNTIPVLLGIYYPATGNGYWFGDPDSYSRYGMIRKVSERRGMTFSGGLNEQGIMGPGEQTRVQVYSNPSSPGYSDIFGFLSDTPTYKQMTEDWWSRQTDSTPITYFAVEDNGTIRKTTVTRPDGVRQVQITDTNPSSGSYAMMVENIVYPASGDTPLARSKRYFETGAYQSSRPVRVEAFDERGQMTVTTFGYGSRFNAPTDMREFGYSGQLLKHVRAEYLNDDNYNGSPQDYGGRWGWWMHIFNLVSVVEVYDGDDSTRVSRVEYEYDGASLEDAPGVARHSEYHNPRDPRYDPRTAYRGNLTQVRRYADAASLDGGSAVVGTFTYDITGNLRVQSTSCCEQTTFNYTSNTQYAWPESMIRGSAGDPTTQNTTSAVYDFNTGLVMEAYDANGRRSNTVYNANSLRPEYGYLPTGAYVYHIYNDAGLYTNDIAYEALRSGSDFASHVDTQFDGRGQVIYEAAFGKDYVRDAVESVYDNLGRLWKRTRPFKEEANPQKQWTVTEYDSMDRPVRGASPDGSVTQNFYNESSSPSAATSTAGQTVRSRDAWGRERWARLDEQNRLVEVVEPNPSGDGSVASGGMSTQYYYDTLGNLTQVNQGAQTRRFRYDSLGRLTHQKLAERAATLNDNGQWDGSGQWSDVFFYDQRSNLVRHVDARGVQTRFNFFNDPLNRLQEVVYDKSGTPANLSANIPEAPNVIYSYMTDHDKMRVREVNASNGTWNRSVEYDIEGRVSQVRQTFAGRENYPLHTNYLWDTLGRIKEVRYPQRYGAGEARKVVTHNYDIASRLNELKYDGTTMASNPVYDASDQITSLVVGGQITENYSFDPKTGLLLSQQVNKGAEQLLSLQYNYTLNNDPNNNGAKTGQLTGITDLKNTARNRAYEYDKLGRLIKVKGGVNAFTNPTWYQTYSYDRYGNRSLVERTDLGMAPVKPGSQSRSDLIGKIGPGAGGAANRIFSVDDPFAALGINEGYGSITAGFSDSDSAGTPVRGGPRVTAEEYGKAPSANGVGGKSLTEHPAGVAPSAPQKKYGARRGLSIVTAQSVSNVSPGAAQSPDPGQGGAAVNSPSNTGHGHTTQFLYDATKTCVWHSFQGVSGQILSITLKFDWGAVVAAGVSSAEGTGGDAYAEFTVDYSLDGGASWNGAAGVSAFATASDGGSDFQVNTNPGGSPGGALTPVSISIPSNTPISQIRVRDRLLTSSFGNAEFGSTSVGNSSPENTMVNNIRLEVVTDTTAPVISNVAAGSITTTSATITWTTNENSDSQVEYGPSQNYGQSTTVNTTLVTAHSQGLSGLTPGTLYHYRVKSRDSAGNLAVSGDFSFTTAPAPDTTPPTVASFSPAAGATNVSPEANVTVTFSEAMDAATVNGSTVELRDPSNALVSATVSYNAASFTATLDPNAPLTVGVTYTARVKGGGTDPRVKDVAGNALATDLTWTFRTSQSGSIPLDGLASLSYNGANNRIDTPGFEYDTAGNQTRAVINASGTQQQYRYDCAGRLAQVLDANGATLAIYSYVEGSQRLMSVEGGVTTYYAWAGGEVSAQYEASGTNALVWKMSYIYMDGKLLATDQAEGIRYHHPDRLGIRLVTDASDGAVVSEQLTMPFGTQVPYGSTLGGNNSWQHPGRSNLSKKRFTSYDRSDATGLDYAMNRFYSAQQGRFTQVDPIEMDAASLGNPQTLNLYAYCGNDPINNVDPDGLFFGFIWKALKAIGKAIANYFSGKIGGYSGPGFRTPPTFPGSLPSTISVSSGRDVNFRTPPFNPGASNFLGQDKKTQKALGNLIRSVPPSEVEETIQAIIAIRDLVRAGLDPEQLVRFSNKQIIALRDALRRGDVTIINDHEFIVHTDDFDIKIVGIEQPGGPATPIKEVYDSIEKSGKVPQGWKAVRGGTTKVNINNKQLLDELRKTLPGQWKKVYKKGVDGSEIHYFEHASGKVFDVKHVVR
jgi:RHS repeat-associated protein